MRCVRLLIATWMSGALLVATMVESRAGERPVIGGGGEVKPLVTTHLHNVFRASTNILRPWWPLMSSWSI